MPKSLAKRGPAAPGPAGRRRAAFLSLCVVFNALAGELSLDGALLQGGLVTGRTAPDARVSFDGRKVRVSDDGVFLLGFGRDAAEKSILRVEYGDGTVTERAIEVARREYDIQRVDGLPQRKVTPKPEDLERIRKEAALVKAARARDDPRTDFMRGFQWPAIGRITGVYGSQRILNGEPRRPHFGVDVAGPVGAPVVAPAAGIVTLAEANLFFSGGTLIIDHGHGLTSSFLHLSAILVKQGQRVRRGDLVARIGATGRVSGAHLDWRMNLSGARLDPQLVVGEMSGN